MGEELCIMKNTETSEASSIEESSSNGRTVVYNSKNAEFESIDPKTDNLSYDSDAITQKSRKIGYCSQNEDKAPVESRIRSFSVKIEDGQKLVDFQKKGDLSVHSINKNDQSPSSDKSKDPQASNKTEAEGLRSLVHHLEGKIKQLEKGLIDSKKEKSNKAREINFLRSENNKLMLDYQSLKREFEKLEDANLDTVLERTDSSGDRFNDSANANNESIEDNDSKQILD